MPRRLSFDVVDGSGRIYGESMAGEPGRGLSGANDDDSVLVAVVGWQMGMFRGRAGGPCGGRGLMLRAGNPRVAVAQWNDRASRSRRGWRVRMVDGLS